MPFRPFTIETCEGDGRASRRLPFKPRPGQVFEPFEIYDPFGLRKAIVPVFRCDAEGRYYGMGSAFHVQGGDAFLTAQHVVDFVECGARIESDDENLLLHDAQGDQPVLYLGVDGVVFGTVRIPDTALAVVSEIRFPSREKDDPLATLQGRSTSEAADIALLRVAYLPNATQPHTLRMAPPGWIPTLGEHVLAVGYSELDCKLLDERAREALLDEGMYGAYARITAVHNAGRDARHATPVFEVEGDWRGGMSGGPVFNASGEVVGLVSRSLAPSGEHPGVGWAVNLPYLGEVVARLR
jgi:serine protease Do